MSEYGKITEKYNQKLIICGTELKARELYEDYKGIDKNTYYYPAKDFIFYSADIHGNELVKERLEVVSRLVKGESITVVTTIDGCMDKLMAGRTTFVIAHRLSTVRNSDCIMVLEQGRIIERGTHDQLIEEQGKYYQLYTGNAIQA
mgnify:CR=1 FL=1